MAAQPRKDLKPAAPVKDAAQAVKQAASERIDGASLDTFNSLPAAAPAGAAADAVRVRAASAEATKGMAGLEPPAQGERHQPPAAGERFTPAPTASLGIAQPEGAAAEAKHVQEAARARLEPALGQFHRGGEPGTGSGTSAAASSVSGAASAAEVAREAVRARLEPAVSHDLTEEQPGVTEEAPTTYADRMGVDLGEMLERLNPDVVGREAGIGEGQDAPTALRDSGRDALEAQADAAFDQGGDTGAQGRTPGRMGTPADLGVTGDFGTKAGLGSGSSGAGMDLFDVSLPGRGVSGAANDLGLMQGMLPGSGAAVGRIPSVAEGETEPDGEPVTEVDGEPADTVEDVPGPDDTEMAAHEDGQWIDHAANFAAAANALTRTFKVSYNATRGAIEVAKNFGVDVDEAVTELAVSLTENGQYAAEQETIAAAVQQQAAANDARKAGVPPPSNPGREGSGIIGTPTAAEMAWRAAARERLGLGSPGSGDVDPADDGNESVPTVGPEPGAQAFLQAGLANRATGEFLFGQPSGPEAGVRGSGSVGFGNLPGDMGNIDYGPDSTGAWTGNTRTESEADALGSFGGSGLSIADAHRSDDDEDDQDDSDDNS